MAKKGLLGVFFILLLTLVSAESDKEKKAYELIYEDVQLLKKQLLQLQEKTGKNAEDINQIREQLKELLNLTKLIQTEQASFKADQKEIPGQYQILLEKLEMLSLRIVKLTEELIEIKRGSAASLQQEKQDEKQGEKIQGPEKKQPPAPEKGIKEVKKEEQAQAATQTPPPPVLSPQEVYNMANSDYLRGNFQLAIDGFKMYMEQFPESPLVDDSLYWIGECYFSQKKFNEAIEVFNELILNYPNGDKIPAAYLKKGISLVELEKKEEALAAFKLLVSKYPLEEETKIAQQKIKELTTKK